MLHMLKLTSTEEISDLRSGPDEITRLGEVDLRTPSSKKLTLLTRVPNLSVRDPWFNFKAHLDHKVQE